MRDDKEAFLQKERERKAQEEAEKKKKNAKNSLENQLKVTRWMSNYDNKTNEIIQDEVAILEDMEKEEMMAGLLMM